MFAIALEYRCYAYYQKVVFWILIYKTRLNVRHIAKADVLAKLQIIWT